MRNYFVEVKIPMPASAPPAGFGVAVRPTLLFVAAYSLSISPHEAVHALVGYILGFNSTLFQMWVDPDAASATPLQLAAIAAAGPLVSLAVGLTCWLLYKKIYRSKPSGLFFLMMAIVGVYSFLGPMVGAAFAGDFNNALRFMAVSRTIQYAISALGTALLSVFMFFIGMELSGWGPQSFGRAKNVISTTVAPWLIAPFFIILLYYPLPRPLIASTFGGSVFWTFAVIGAAVGSSGTRPDRAISALTRFDVIAIIVAIAMVRTLAHGVRLAH
jgi:hypothetical protein